MSRAFLLSILLHTLAIAFVFVMFRQNSAYPHQSIKKISLSTIVIKKPVAEEAKSLEPKAKSKKSKTDILKAKSELKPEIKKVAKIIKKPIVKKPIPKKQVEKKIAKNIHKSVKHKVIKKNYKKLKKKSNKKSVKKKKFMQVKKAVAIPKSSNSIQRANTSPNPNIKAQIYRAINSAKVYPRFAKRMKQQGGVYTCFTLNSNGSVSNLTTSGASGILQKGARQTINRAKQNFPTVPRAMHLCVTINYVLE